METDMYSISLNDILLKRYILCKNNSGKVNPKNALQQAHLTI